MIEPLGFKVVCDRCQNSVAPHRVHATLGAPSKALARRAAKAAGWALRWKPRKFRERGHFEDVCPDCQNRPAGTSTFGSAANSTPKVDSPAQLRQTADGKPPATGAE